MIPVHDVDLDPTLPVDFSYPAPPQADFENAGDDRFGFLHVPPNTLYRWRHHDYGPPGRRVGRYVRYDPADLRAWFEAQADGPT